MWNIVYIYTVVLIYSCISRSSCSVSSLLCAETRGIWFVYTVFWGKINTFLLCWIFIRGLVVLSSWNPVSGDARCLLQWISSSGSSIEQETRKTLEPFLFATWQKTKCRFVGVASSTALLRIWMWPTVTGRRLICVAQATFEIWTLLFVGFLSSEEAQIYRHHFKPKLFWLHKE